ncbi:sentrin-specific protease 2 [Crotalus tigris]|uniref:sentrin-specific protease 2 n=1 Tax=Crotalus tigris TaxID=88082 RepID=UPI00192F2F25|nr:sentrin-specific protease 2 [Crotalus tigris]XP_039212295.1 sentrin-specific protease 2 [Crotalus tigris]
MYKWVCETLRSWVFSPSSCHRDVEPSLPRPRKRRYHSSQSYVEEPDQEQTKRQKLDIFGIFTQGIVSLIKLPSHLTAKYFQVGDQYAETTKEFFSNASDALADKQMQPNCEMQMCNFDKKASYGTCIHPDVASDSRIPVTYMRDDFTSKNSNKKSHNVLQEDLRPWRHITRRHSLEAASLESGRCLRKPHYTVEEGVQRLEQEKYKELLKQGKEKSLKIHSSAAVANYHNIQDYATGSLKFDLIPSSEMPRNGIKNFGPLGSNNDMSRSIIIAKRTTEHEKVFIQKKENSMQPLMGNDLSEEVSLRLSLVQKESSYRRRSLVEIREKYLSLEKATECFPEFTEDMETEIANALSYGQDDEILTSAFKLNITRRDIQTLRNQQWLNDVVINFYMNLLVERNKMPGFPVLYAFSTFFYSKLSSMGYNAVKRWTKEVDLFQHDIILVPIHIRLHWALVVIDLRRKTIKYFDSMGQNGIRICMRLLQYLQEESKAKKNLDINVSSWILYSMKPHEIPQQLNGSDCGMFTCKFADFVTRDKPIAFTQFHMPYYRKKMVWEILHQKLL